MGLFVALWPADVPDDPLAELVQIRHPVLTREVQPAADLRIVVEQAVEAHQRDPRITGARGPKLHCYRRRGWVHFGTQTPSLHTSIFRIGNLRLRSRQGHSRASVPEIAASLRRLA